MLARMIMIVVVAALAVIAFGPTVYEHMTGVGVMRASSSGRREKTVPERRPTAEAYIIGSNLESDGPYVVVPVYSITDIYASLGVAQKEFFEWQGRYGVGTLGRTDEGVLFVPTYPVLSKIAWMGIDSIDLSTVETSMLIEECTRARSRSVSAAASTELDALIALGRRAIAVGGAIRFGLP